MCGTIELLKNKLDMINAEIGPKVKMSYIINNMSAEEREGLSCGTCENKTNKSCKTNKAVPGSEPALV